jgi:hypothetical protein
VQARRALVTLGARGQVLLWSRLGAVVVGVALVAVALVALAVRAELRLLLLLRSPLAQSVCIGTSVPSLFVNSH